MAARTHPSKAILSLWWKSWRRRGPSGPLPVVLGVAWVAVPLRAVQESLAMGDPGEAAALLHASLVAFVPVLAALAVLVGMDPLSATPRLALLPWAGRPLRLTRLALRSPFALVASALSGLVFLVGHQVALPLPPLDRALSAVAILGAAVLTYLVCVAVVEVVARRLPALGSWAAFVVLVLTSVVVVRPGAALEFPGLDSLAAYRPDPGALSAAGRWGALGLGLAAAAALASTVQRARIEIRVRPAPDAAGAWLLGLVERVFGIAARKEVALIWRALILRNSLFASVAWAGLVVVAGAPFGLVFTFMFWLLFSFNALGFDLPFRGTTRYRLLPGGLVRAVHRREATIHAVTAFFTVPLAILASFTTQMGRADLLGWLLLGHGAYSVAAVAGRFSSLSRPKALHPRQFFVHGGVLTLRGYLSAVATLIGVIVLAIMCYAGAARLLGSGAVARGVGLGFAALLLLSIHVLVRTRERALGRLIGE